MSRMRAKVSYVNICQFTALRFEGKSCCTVVIIILTSDFACDVMLKIDRFGVSLNAKDTMLKYIPITIVIILTCLSQSEAQYDDKRCKCICPSLSSVINTTQSSMERLAYIINVPPLQCKCENVVLPKIGDQIKGKEEIFCPRCDCKYENRNTTIIKIVVIIVIWVISLLVIYMLFLICLDPLLNKRIHKASANIGYHEHNNEDDDSSLAPGTSHPMGERGNVLNRVGHQQDKWKRQVREQRRNIYDRHTMLN